jgi:hypothetical protein
MLKKGMRMRTMTINHTTKHMPIIYQVYLCLLASTARPVIGLKIKTTVRGGGGEGPTNNNIGV